MTENGLKSSGRLLNGNLIEQIKEVLFKRILIFAPHTDDGKFGCGGSIKFIEEKMKLS